MLDLIYEGLDAGQREKALEHIASCPDCAREYEGMKETLAAVRDLPDPELPPFLNTRLSAYASEETMKPRSMWAWVMRPGVAVAAMVVISASVVIIISGEKYEGAKAPVKSIVKLDEAMKAHEAEESVEAPDSLVMHDAPMPAAPPVPCEDMESEPKPEPSFDRAVRTGAEIDIVTKDVKGPARKVVASAPAHEGKKSKPRMRMVAAEREEVSSSGSMAAPLDTRGVLGAPAGDVSGKDDKMGEEFRKDEVADGSMGLVGGAISRPVVEEAAPPPRMEKPAPKSFAPKPAAAPARASGEALAGKGVGYEADHFVDAEDKLRQAAPMNAPAAGAPAAAAPAGMEKAKTPVSPIKRGKELEKAGKYKEALELYERKLSSMGHSKGTRTSTSKFGKRSGGKPVRSDDSDATPAEPGKGGKAVVCSAELKKAVKGAARCYKKLGRKAEARAVEKWYKSECKD